MKQNFFDNLDGGWGDIIADTYKEANSILFINHTRNITATIDHSTLKENENHNCYYEMYTSLDKKYKVGLSLLYGEYYFTGKEGAMHLQFSLHVNDNKTANSITNIGVIIRFIKGDIIDYIIFCSSDEDKDIIAIDKLYIKNFINKAVNIINNKPEYKDNQIKTEMIEKLLVELNNNTKNI